MKISRKVLLKIISSRIKQKYGAEMAEEQAGFVERNGTREQIVNIRNIIEKCRDHNTPLYMCFIDYAKAFDCVSHRKLWMTMKQMGFPTHLTQLMAALYEKQESAVRTSDGDSNWFKIKRGVRQGCVMSPPMYNIYAENIMREVLEDHEGGINIGGTKTTNLRFADDTTLLCNSKDELLNLLKRVKDISKTNHLLLNTKKTKVMVVDKNRKEGDDFIVDGEKIEEVESFIYLGSVINIKGSSTQETRRRLAIARGTVQKMVTVWKSRGMSLGLKKRLLQATAFSIATYGCESWAMTMADKKRVDAFEQWCYRRLLRVSWTEKRTNEWVLNRIGSGLILRKGMTKRKLRLFGHIMRKEGLEQRLAQGVIEGRRRRGRPAVSWCQDIKDWTGLSMAEAYHLTADRTGWREVVAVTAALPAPPD